MRSWSLLSLLLLYNMITISKIAFTTVLEQFLHWLKSVFSVRLCNQSSKNIAKSWSWRLLTLLTPGSHNWHACKNSCASNRTGNVSSQRVEFRAKLLMIHFHPLDSSQRLPCITKNTCGRLMVRTGHSRAVMWVTSESVQEYMNFFVYMPKTCHNTVSSLLEQILLILSGTL